MARSFSRTRRPAAPRRRLFWARAREFVVPASADDNVLHHNLLADFEGRYGADLFGFTVTRIRGVVSFAADIDGTHPAGSPAAFSFGIRVADDSAMEALDQDEESNQLPRFNPEADWMHVEEHVVSRADSSMHPNIWNDYEIDVKAQRRLDELGQGLYMFFGEPLSDVTVLPNGYFYNLSILCKRP